MIGRKLAFALVLLTIVCTFVACEESYDALNEEVRSKRSVSDSVVVSRKCREVDIKMTWFLLFFHISYRFLFFNICSLPFWLYTTRRRMRKRNLWNDTKWIFELSKVNILMYKKYLNFSEFVQSMFNYQSICKCIDRIH